MRPAGRNDANRSVPSNITDAVSFSTRQAVESSQKRSSNPNPNCEKNARERATSATRKFGNTIDTVVRSVMVGR